MIYSLGRRFRMKCYRVFFNFRLSMRWLGPSTSPIHWSLSLASLVALVHEWNPEVLYFPTMVLFWVSFGRLFFYSFYHLVSMRWLFLRARWSPCPVRGPTISTFFAGWYFAFFQIRLSSYLLICYPLWPVYL